MNQPDSPLRAARVARKWSQARVAEELAALAAERGTAVAAPVSLKTQLSRWENQHATPEAHYRALMCELYDSTEVELGLADPAADPGPAEPGESRLRADLATAAALDTEGLSLLREQIATTRRLDHRLGTAAAQELARAQLTHLGRTLAHTVRERPRRELAGLVAAVALLVGEHARDRVLPDEAWQHFETAKAASRESEDPVLLGCAMVRQASLLIDIGEHTAGAGLIDQAAHLAGADAPAPVLAWITASMGHAWAAAGAEDRARSAYRRAEQQITRPTARIDLTFPAATTYLNFDLTALHRHRGHTELVLHDEEAAIADLEDSLATDGAPARALAGIHVDLAYAYGRAGHPDPAAVHAGRARELTARIGSVRLARLLDERRPAPVTANTATGC